MNVLRWLTLNDMPDVAAFEALCFPSFWSAKQFSSAWHEDWFAAYGSFSSDSLVAYITLSVLDGELEVLNIAVHPRYRGQGLSRPLMGYALADTFEGGHLVRRGREKKGWNRGFLEVRPSNAPAIALYTSLGFRKAGLRKHYYADGEDAAVLTLDCQDFWDVWQGEVS